MVSADWSQMHHLTRRGWVPGTRIPDGASSVSGERPAEVVEIWVESHTGWAHYTHDRYTYTMLWRDECISDDERSAMKERFRAPFRISA